MDRSLLTPAVSKMVPRDLPMGAKNVHFLELHAFDMQPISFRIVSTHFLEKCLQFCNLLSPRET